MNSVFAMFLQQWHDISNELQRRQEQLQQQEQEWEKQCAMCAAMSDEQEGVLALTVGGQVFHGHKSDWSKDKDSFLGVLVSEKYGPLEENGVKFDGGSFWAINDFLRDFNTGEFDVSGKKEELIELQQSVKFWCLDGLLTALTDSICKVFVLICWFPHLTNKQC